MRVAIGADHGGFELKRELMAALTKKGLLPLYPLFFMRMELIL